MVFGSWKRWLLNGVLILATFLAVTAWQGRGLVSEQTPAPDFRLPAFSGGTVGLEGKIFPRGNVGGCLALAGKKSQWIRFGLGRESVIPWGESPTGQGLGEVAQVQPIPDAYSHFPKAVQFQLQYELNVFRA